LVTIAGIHAVRHALQSGDVVAELIIEKGKKHPRLNELIHLARQAHVRVSFAPHQALNRMADTAVHQGVVATLADVQQPTFEDWLNKLDIAAKPLVLLLDSITDPHNLGACLRSADAAGCAGVVLPRDRSAAPSPVVAKAACGAMRHLPVLRVTNLVRAMASLQELGFWLTGLTGEAEATLYQAKFDAAAGIVMGSEDKGLRPLVRQQCDVLVRIPMEGLVESLNVSVATGITLFEVRRQRQAIGPS